MRFIHEPPGSDDRGNPIQGIDVNKLIDLLIDRREVAGNV